MSDGKMRRWLCKAALLGVMTAAGTMTALAAGVSSLRIDFTSSYEIGEIVEPEVEVTTSGVELDSLTWSKKPEDWKPGSRVAVTMILLTTDGRDFSDSYGSKTIRINGATFGSAKRTGEGQLKVIAHYYPVVQLDSPEEAGWSGASKRMAVWKKSKYATAYQIRLYRDGDLVRSLDATGTSKDLSEYMTKEGDYSYEIRAVAKDSGDAKYMKSSEYVGSTDRPLAELGDTSGQFRTYAAGKKYQKSDGSYVANQWYQIQGEWYYFKADEYAVTGWLSLNGTWYYLGADGRMSTGWKEIAGVWYYLNPDGSMATGWVQTAPNQWCYLNPDGSMAANTVVDGRQLDASGIWIE